MAVRVTYADGLNWRSVNNTVKKKTIEGSLLQTLEPTKKIKRRTKALNIKLNRRTARKNYHWYVETKTSILRNITDNDDTDDDVKLYPIGIEQNQDNSSLALPCSPQNKDGSIESSNSDSDDDSDCTDSPKKQKSRKRKNDTIGSHSSAPLAKRKVETNKNVPQAASVAHEKMEEKNLMNAKRNLTSFLEDFKDDSVIIGENVEIDKSDSHEFRRNIELQDSVQFENFSNERTSKNMGLGCDKPMTKSTRDDSNLGKEGDENESEDVTISSLYSDSANDTDSAKLLKKQKSQKRKNKAPGSHPSAQLEERNSQENINIPRAESADYDKTQENGLTNDKSNLISLLDDIEDDGSIIDEGIDIGKKDSHELWRNTALQDSVRSKSNDIPMAKLTKAVPKSGIEEEEEEREKEEEDQEQEEDEEEEEEQEKEEEGEKERTTVEKAIPKSEIEEKEEEEEEEGEGEKERTTVEKAIPKSEIEEEEEEEVEEEQEQEEELEKEEEEEEEKERTTIEKAIPKSEIEEEDEESEKEEEDQEQEKDEEEEDEQEQEEEQEEQDKERTTVEEEAVIKRSQPVITSTEIVRAKYTIVRDEGEITDPDDTSHFEYPVVEKSCSFHGDTFLNDEEASQLKKLSAKSRRVAQRKKINLVSSNSSDSQESQNSQDNRVDANNRVDVVSPNSNLIDDSDESPRPSSSQIISDPSNSDESIDEPDSTNHHKVIDKSIISQIREQENFHSSTPLKKIAEAPTKPKNNKSNLKKMNSVRLTTNDALQKRKSLEKVLENVSTIENFITTCNEEEENEQICGNELRPIELSEFVDREGLVATEELSTITAKDLKESARENSDEEIWLMEIPKSIITDGDELCGKTMVFEKGKMRINGTTYQYKCRDEKSVTCILRSRKKKPRFKTVNMEAVRCIVVREKFSHKKTPLSPVQSVCEFRSIVPFPKNLKSRNPLLGGLNPTNGIDHLENEENGKSTSDILQSNKNERKKAKIRNVNNFALYEK